MITRLISFANTAVAITYEGDQPARIVDFLYRKHSRKIDRALDLDITYHLLSGDKPNILTLYRGNNLLYAGDSPAMAAELLLGDACYHLAAQSRGGLLFHAAGLAWHERGLLVPGATGTGKSTLAAWLLTQGFDYLSDELVFVPWGSATLQGFTRPLNLKVPARSVLQPYIDLAGQTTPILSSPQADLIPATLFQSGAILGEATLDRIIFPAYEPGSKFSLDSLSKAQAGLKLMQSLINARNLPEHGFSEIARLARQVPAYQLHYSNFAQIGQQLENRLFQLK